MNDIPQELLDRRLPELGHLRRLIEGFGAGVRTSVYDYVAVDGHELPLYALEIGSQSPNVPAIGFFGGVHGVERIGTEILLSFLHTLSERMKWEADLGVLLENICIVIVPLVNPGGMWKNRRSNPNGVDLMRNAPVEPDQGTTFLVGGQRISRLLPWYRGRRGEAMEPEARFVVDTVRERLLGRPFSIALDCHSGYGQQDRLWFLHASSAEPFKHLPEVYALKSLFENTYPHHDYYTIEPQSANYTTKGDLWDFLFDESLGREKGLFIPLTLELGSLFWVRKNPRQALRYSGYFNPVMPVRKGRTLRRHLLLLEFLTRATRNYKNWLTAYSDISNVQQAALREWYSRHEETEAAGEKWILVRGLVRESRHWGAFPEMFKSRFPDADVHAVDIPGTGRRSHETTPATIDGILEACRERLAQLGIAPPYNMVAISMGAMLVMQWARRFPDEIDKAVLINPSVRDFSRFYQRLRPRTYPRLGRHLLLRTDAVERESDILALTTNLIEARRREELARQWAQYARERPVTRANALRQLLAAARYRLDGCPPPMPVLLLGSAKDRLVDPDCFIRIANRWRVPLRIHPEAGHDLPLDDPAWVVDSIAEWQAELEPARAASGEAEERTAES